MAAPGLIGPAGVPTNAARANASWNKLVNALAHGVPKELHAAQATTRTLARKRR